QGLLELTTTSILPDRLYDGLRDTVHVLLDAARGADIREGGDSGPPVSGEILRKIETIDEALEHPGVGLRAAVELLTQLSTLAAEIVAAVRSDGEVQWWATAFERSCADYRADLLRCAPWLGFPPIPRG